MKKTDAYLTGVRAYYNDWAITDNPYDNEKLEHSEFETGWLQAKEFDQVYLPEDNQ